MNTITDLLNIANDSVKRLNFDEANEFILEGAFVIDVREESEVAQTGRLVMLFIYQEDLLNLNLILKHKIIL